MTASQTTLWIVFGLYTLAVLAYMLSLLHARFAESRWPLRLAVIGLAAHAVCILMLALEQKRVPLASPSESYSFAAFALMCLFVATQRRSRGTLLGVFVCLLAVVLMRQGLDAREEPVPRLLAMMGHHWSAIHVAASIASYAGFTLSFGAALAYALQERMLKAKRMNGFQRSLPSLDAADGLAYRMVAFGFLMLTLAIVTGALWAAATLGSLWQWQGAQIWSLVAWLVYLAYLHMRVIRGWRGKWGNRLLILGFICLVGACLRSGFFTA